MAWKWKMLGQLNYLPACLKIFSYDVMFADVILTLILNFWISQIFWFFLKDLITGSLKLKKVLQCLIYNLRYRSLNSDKFVKQKLEPPPSANNSKFNCFLVKLPLLFNFHIRHLHCRKLKEKKNLKKKFPTAQKKRWNVIPSFHLYLFTLFCNVLAWPSHLYVDSEEERPCSAFEILLVTQKIYIPDCKISLDFFRCSDILIHSRLDPLLGFVTLV